MPRQAPAQCAVRGLEGLTVPQLRAKAKQKKLVGFSRMKKAELCTALRAGKKKVAAKNAAPKKKVVPKKVAAKKKVVPKKKVAPKKKVVKKKAAPKKTAAALKSEAALKAKLTEAYNIAREATLADDEDDRLQARQLLARTLRFPSAAELRQMKQMVVYDMLPLVKAEKRGQTLDARRKNRLASLRTLLEFIREA